MDYREPLEVAIGDTAIWTRVLPDYQASDGWALSYALRGPAVVDITSEADGDNHLVTIASDTLTVAGTYFVQGFVTKDSVRHSVYRGRIIATPDLSAADANYDGSSHAAKVIAAIEAVIEGRATRDQQEMQVDGDRLVRTPFEVLIQIRNRYRHELASEVAREKRKQGRKVSRNVKFKF